MQTYICVYIYIYTHRNRHCSISMTYTIFPVSERLGRKGRWEQSREHLAPIEGPHPRMSRWRWSFAEKNGGFILGETHRLGETIMLDTIISLLWLYCGKCSIHGAYGIGWVKPPCLTCFNVGFNHVSPCFNVLMRLFCEYGYCVWNIYYAGSIYGSRGL